MEDMIKTLQDEVALKDKEITLLINHCDTLLQQSNTLQLLNDFDNILDENKYLYEYVDKLKNELKDSTNNTENIININNKEQEHLTKLLQCKDNEINILNDKILINKKFIKEQEELIIKQNDELIDLNFIIYNHNNNINDLQVQIEDRDREILQLNQQMTNIVSDKNKEIEELKMLNDHYVKLIEEIKMFIANIQQSQYIPLFNPARIVDNLMIIFKEKILCQDKDYDPLLITPPSSPLKPPKPKKMKKKIDNRS